MQKWGGEKKVGMVADDTMIAIKATRSSFIETVKVLKAFEMISGLKVNYEKSVICRLGSNNETNFTLTTECNFIWLQRGQPFTYLGTKLVVDPQGHIVGKGNFEFSKADLDRILSKLRFGDNSMLGKVLIIKSLLASRFIYRLSLLATPEKFLCAADKYFRSVLWGGHRPRIAADTMQLETQKGGFKMLNVFLQNKSLKFQWIHRLLNGETGHFWQIQLHNTVKLPIVEVLKFNLCPSGWHKLVKNIKSIPPFWRDVLRLWYSTNYVSGARRTPEPSRILQMPLCFNSAFSYHRTDIMDVYEQLKALGVITFEQFLRKKATLKDNDIIGWFHRRVPVVWQQTDVDADLRTTLYMGVVRQKWSAKLVYEFPINDTKHIPKAIGSWSREWTNPISQGMWLVTFQLMFLN